MQAKLMPKSKVIQTRRPKSQVFRRRVRPERANTPQRWSRRIRSLPPIPINVLKPRRKIRKNCTNINTRRERCTSTSFLEEYKRRNMQHKLNKERRRSVFVDKTDKRKYEEINDSVDVVRIVPVVVYVKNSKPNKTFIPEEIRVHINDNPTCQMVSQAIDTHIHSKIKQERLSVGGRHSKRIRMTAEDEGMVPVAKRKYLCKKKLLMYN